MASIIEKTYQEMFLEPEQPPVEPAIEALEFIRGLNPKSPGEIRDFFKEYQLYGVLTAVIETLGESSPSSLVDAGFMFGGKNSDKSFHIGIVPEWGIQDPTSLPEHVRALVFTYSQDRSTGNTPSTIKDLFIKNDGTLQGRETLFNEDHRLIKDEDFDELGSFDILKHLCGAMIDHLSILKEEREESLAGQVALAA